jgi:hypothetical protein
MISFQGLLPNLGIDARWLSALLVSAAVLVFLWSVRAAPLWRLFALTAVASLWIVPHVYGYDASLLLLPILLTIFRSAAPASRIAATLLSTPLPFGFALAGKPWAIVSSASVAIFLSLLASERNELGLKDRARPS